MQHAGPPSPSSRAFGPRHRARRLVHCSARLAAHTQAQPLLCSRLGIRPSPLAAAAQFARGLFKTRKVCVRPHLCRRRCAHCATHCTSANLSNWASMVILYTHTVPMPTSPYQCRLCQAKTYRRLQPSAEGVLLFRCSGCAVVFSDPVAWRDGPPPPPPLEESARALLQSWGGVLEGAFPRQQSPEELQRIQEAAQRANKAKRRR